MELNGRYFWAWLPTRERQGRGGTAADTGPAGVEVAMARALAGGLQYRDEGSQIAAHSARVAELACAMAELLDVPKAAIETLRSAAHLHEIGMVAVPPDLLIRPCPLSASELERVRGQAAIGGEIVRCTVGAVGARLIERQYVDFCGLRSQVSDTAELLLTGILRVADVFDAMTEPRPYQSPVPQARRRQVLRMGSGTKFHPAAVYALLSLPGSSRGH